MQELRCFENRTGDLVSAALALPEAAQIAAYVAHALECVLRFGVPERDAPDVAQQVLLVASQTWATFRGSPDVPEQLMRRRWLFRIAWHKAAE